MPPSEELTTNKSPNLSRPPSKRRLQDQPPKKSAASLPESSRSSSSQSTLPFTKRLKTSHSTANIGPRMDMGATQVISSRPKVVDLTTSNFQPTTGAKKLIIKNLRTKSRQDVGEYYQRTWVELDDTLMAIFSKDSPRAPLEVLCRGVEATCRRGEAEKLAVNLRDRCKSYLENTLLPKIENESGSTNVEALWTVHKHWLEWNKQAVSSAITLEYYC
jgi:cullin-4